MSVKLFCALAVSILLLTSCRQRKTGSTLPSLDPRKMTVVLKSTAFSPSGVIPSQYTCDGENISPPLVWSRVPKAAKSLVLIVTDPDAPGGTWTHWIVWNLPPTVKGLPRHVSDKAVLDNGARQNHNDFKKIGYGGPCPPHGSTHRYVFTLYALSVRADLSEGSTTDIHDAIEDNVLAAGQLMGQYSR